MNFSLSDTWLSQLPTDIYDQLAHCLSLHGMVCAELFSRPDSALVQQLALLTPINAATVAELNVVQSREELLAAWAWTRRWLSRFYGLCSSRCTFPVNRWP
jgi:hypothetical protein